MISESDSHTYLGVTMDKNLTMKEHLAKTYKKVLSRKELLARIRHHVRPWAAETMYKVMMLPLMLYCSNIMLGISNHGGEIGINLPTTMHQKGIITKMEDHYLYPNLICSVPAKHPG